MVFDPTKAGKTLCTCGMPADTFGGLCDRCASLQLMGLGTGATPDEIENTYRTLVKVWHPDRFAHDPKLRKDAEEKLKEINGAHEYLLAHPRQEPPRNVPPPERPPNYGRPFEPSSGIDPEGEETEEVQRILRRRKKSRVPAILMKVGLALAAVTIVVIIWFTGDSFLSSNPMTARAWDQLKLEVQHDVAVHFNSATTSQAQQTIAAPAPVPVSTPAPAPSSTPVSATLPKTVPNPAPAEPSAKETVVHGKPVQHFQGAKPYITAGLTPMEVLSVLGKPTTSTGEKMTYSGSEIDFKNGQVSGWKIDPASPIRVKLWSDSPSVPGLTTFGVGSSKSDVIALQGTPTLFSENEFGYGKSRVYFQNNRVVSWKQDSSSAPLKVAR